MNGCCAVRTTGTIARIRSTGTAGRNIALATSWVISVANSTSPTDTSIAATCTRRNAWSNTRHSRSRSWRATRWVSEGSSEVDSTENSSTNRSTVWNA